MRYVSRLIAVWLLAMASVQAAECPRIVSQSPYLTMAIEWLGQGECIVGVSRYDSFKPKLPRTGGVMDPDAKAIAALKPDVVIGSDMADEAAFAAAVPKGAKAARMGGFNSMFEVESMLEDIALLIQSSEGGKVASFRRGWFTRAKNTGARGERVLLLTACSGTPYSYGRKHVLGDLFYAAGFNVVEEDVRVRAVRAGEAVPDLAALIARTQPDIVFTFNRAADTECKVVLEEKPGVKIIPLDGDNFLNPGHRMIDGLDEVTRIMRAQRTQ
ncbi:ABC transporter substrate-binding protein [Denitromonas halophila]|uniref:ABC transporter substrate-binding protein n=1 Tax=Denitromonas halophila TaxID=1629404 RepID=A0A557QXU2_9RHOO|nr:ABC transporter substrate-binding protein [Denitromonas halophila]TVO57737.1 ABC transporter substrate-binding protein [Denitromonas halophila]